MNMVPVDVRIVERVYGRKGSNIEFIERFRDMGVRAVEVTGFTQKNAYSCAASLKNTIKEQKMPHIKACIREGKVYLINTLIR